MQGVKQPTYHKRSPHTWCTYGLPFTGFWELKPKGEQNDNIYTR